MNKLKFLFVGSLFFGFFFFAGVSLANYSRDYSWGSGDGGDWARVTYDLSTELVSPGWQKTGGNSTRGEQFIDSNGDGKVDQFSFERYAQSPVMGDTQESCDKSGCATSCVRQVGKGDATYCGSCDCVAYYESVAWSASYRITGVVSLPAAPSGFSAGLTDNCQISTSWSDIRDDDGYDIQRSTDGVNWGIVASPGWNAASWTDGGVSNNTTYFYRIRSKNAAGVSGWSGSISVVINFCRIYSQSGSGSNYWNGRSWGLNAEVIPSGANVNILGRGGNTEIQNPRLEDQNGNGYVDTFVADIKSFQWRQECNKGICWWWWYPVDYWFEYSVQGIEASIPSAPQNLSAGLSCPNVNLTWQDTSANESGFRVERAPAGSGAFGTLANLGAGATSYADANITDGNYDYRVFAYNSFGDSASSNAANISVSCNQPPAAINLNISENFCASPLRPTLFWQFSDPNAGDSQSAYQVQVDDNGDFSSPEVNSAKTASGLNYFSPASGALSFNTLYNWRVMVWDSKDAASPWMVGAAFRTQPHLCPAVDFSWSPSKPSVGEKVKFTESVMLYGGASIASRNWDIPDASRYIPPQGRIKSFFSRIFGWLVKNIFAVSLSDQNPEIIFDSAGSKSVRLEITDSDGLTNSAAKTVDVNVALPKWKEIPSGGQ